MLFQMVFYTEKKVLFWNLRTLILCQSGCELWVLLIFLVPNYSTVQLTTGILPAFLSFTSLLFLHVCFPIKQLFCSLMYLNTTAPVSSPYVFAGVQKSPHLHTKKLVCPTFCDFTHKQHDPFFSDLCIILFYFICTKVLVERSKASEFYLFI